MLFQKARQALTSEGKIIIVDVCMDGNIDCSIAWEFRYIFYDTFGRFLFKPIEIYTRLLLESGFVNVTVTEMSDTAFYTVIVAEVDPSLSVHKSLS
jgi:hypothetical protein